PPPRHLHPLPTRRSSDLPIRLTTTSTRPSPSKSPNAAPRFRAGFWKSPPARSPASSNFPAPVFARRRLRCRELRRENSSTLSSRSEEHTSELQSRGHLVC